MAAFTPHQLYRTQLHLLSGERRIAALCAHFDELAELGGTWKLAQGAFRPGARPYAQQWLVTGPTPQARVYALECYAEGSDVAEAAGLQRIGQHQHPELGAVVLRRVRTDAGVPGLRALPHLRGRRIASYRPGHRLWLRGVDADDSVVDLRSAALARRLYEDALKLRSHAPLAHAAAPLVHRPRLAAVSYAAPHGVSLANAARAGDAFDAIAELGRLHGRIAASGLECSQAQSAEERCWYSVAAVNRLARAHPGFADLAAELIAAITTAHAREPGGTLQPTLELHGLHGYRLVEQELRLEGAAALLARPAAALAATVREWLEHHNIARSESLFERYLAHFDAGDMALTPRALARERGHRKIALAVNRSQRLDPYGDETARALLRAAHGIFQRL